MTNEKDNLQQELQAKIKEGIKPSDIKRLKRSKSADDITQIPAAPPLPACPYCPPLKQQLSQLKDNILQLRLDRLKDFSTYQEETKALNQELDDNITYGVKEIEKLETKLKALHKKKLELQQQLGQAQTKNARLELELMEEGKSPHHPTPPFWNDYGMIILLLGLYCLSTWLLNKTTENN